MKTPCVFAILAAAAFAPAAPAQLIGVGGPSGGNHVGSIVYWRSTPPAPTPSSHSKFFIHTTLNYPVALYPNRTNNPSSLSIYPNGRQFFVEEPVGPGIVVPTTLRPRTVLRFMPERSPASSITLTNFNGPEYLERAEPRWSSNVQDSFVSFQSYNPVTNLRKVYRFNGPMSAFFSPLFTPFVPNDSRLQVVTTFGGDSFTNDWNNNGVRLMFSTPAPFGFVTSIRDTMANTTTVVNDPAVSGFSLRDPVFSPVNPDVVFAIGETPGGLRGLAFFNVTNQAFGFIMFENSVVNATPIANFTSPQISPDGQWLALTLVRTARVGTVTGPFVTLVRVPVFGGSYELLHTIAAGTDNSYDVTGWTPAP
jgi:hypothetical protein